MAQTDPQNTDLNIYQRINACMQDIDYVQKDAAVSAGGSSYMAVTHDAVVGLVRQAMVQHGIVVEPKLLVSEMVQLRDLKADIKQHFYAAHFDVRFINIDKPEDFASVTVDAHAMDTQDKAPGKAMSYAVKYAMLKLFAIETGENEESRYGEPYTPAQLEVYHELLDQEKAYEFYLFVNTLTPEAAAGLHNSFDKGKKSAGKKKAAELESAGAEEFAHTVQQVQERLANQDISVIEITDEMAPVEKKFLAARLSEFEVRQLKKIKEASSE